MNDRIKESYESLKMTQASKDRIYQRILEEEKDSSVNTKKHNSERKFFSGWKVGVAACLSLALIIPTSVYAAGKISRFFKEAIHQDNLATDIDLQIIDTTDKYIQVTTDFGEKYQMEEKSVSYLSDENGNITKIVGEVEKGSNGMYCYLHKDGYAAGKDFYFNVIYMDESEDSVLTLYNQSSTKEITVNDHRALLCETGTVQDTRYARDYDSDYTIDLYVFYEEYGYIINFCGMQGLGQEKLVSLAEKTVVTETVKDKACDYIFLSSYCKSASASQDNTKIASEEITEPVREMGEQVKHDGMTYQVTDVKVSSVVTDTDLSKFNTDTLLDGDREKETGLWDQKGKLKSYIRETIQTGDGVSESEETVVETENVQLRMVYVTMKVKAEKKNTFEAPSIAFLEKTGGRYYDSHLYDKTYNRPQEVENALIDFMPCYFKETAGGKRFYLREMKAGEEQVYHFAYMVDGDMTDVMYLCIDNNTSIDEERQYIVISGQ